ncbi:MAG: hypothetical protein FJ109_08095 [Deltaproteobacteria bacterium]|nr:hypothetical protein [Deltaproteobacteria bacterium]
MIRFLLVFLIGVAVGGCSGADGKRTDIAPDSGPADEVGEAGVREARGEPDAPGLPDVPPASEVGPDGTESVDALEVTVPDGPQDVPEDVAPPSPPGVEFERFCQGKSWEATLTPATVGKLSGSYLGVYKDFPAGTMEMSKFVPTHPFRVDMIRVAFAGTGKARLRLLTTFGRSYPGGYPDISLPEVNLAEPINLELTEADPEEFVEIDVSGQGIYLLPTQHYSLVYHHFASEPFLAVESVPVGEFSRGLILVPKQFEPYGIDGNYRMELVGQYFCSWDDSERWLGQDIPQPFHEDGATWGAFGDLDGDGHDDVVMSAGGPTAYLGDGKGQFTKADPPLFPPAALYSNMTVLGDMDNDGDEDAFAPTWIGWDGDGDKVTILDGDCNDGDAAIHAGAEEVEGNGIDEDCDGVVDDGLSEEDVDADGLSVADGDCNDVRADIFPGAPEVPDSADNDCDLGVGEDSPNRVLLNEGKDGFVVVPDSGVETRDPTGAAAMGDANGDGFLDVYWGNWLKHYPDAPSVPDRFALGNGDGTFVDATEAALLVPPDAQPCYGTTFVDYNGDGLQDIWVGNYQLNPNFLWENQGDGTFLDVAEAVGVDHDATGYMAGHTYGGDFADIDNDGDLDLFEPNLSHPRTMPDSDRSRMLINQGPPDFEFVDKAPELGFIYDEGDVNAAFADYDNDGDLDLILATLYTGHYSKFYRNDGPAGFIDITYETGTAVHDAIGAAWSDVDEDGDVDLLIADREGAQHNQLFINRVGQDLPFVQLKLEGTKSNRSGIGALVKLKTGAVTQMREVKGGGRHMNAQDSRIVHFGLGQATSVDQVTVRWVGGKTETFSGIQPKHRYKLVEGMGKAEVIW